MAREIGEKWVEYKAFVRRRNDKYDTRWQGVSIGWSESLAKVKRELRETLDEWDGKPRRTAREIRSAQFAQEMMITDWKILSREVTKLPNVLEGSRELPDLEGIEDPAEDVINL